MLGKVKSFLFGGAQTSAEGGGGGVARESSPPRVVLRRSPEPSRPDRDENFGTKQTGSNTIQERHDGERAYYQAGGFSQQGTGEARTSREGSGHGPNHGWRSGQEGTGGYVEARTGREEPGTSQDGSGIGSRTNQKGLGFESRTNQEGSGFGSRTNQEGLGFESRTNHEGSGFGSRTNEEGSDFRSRMNEEGSGFGSRTNEEGSGFGSRTNQEGSRPNQQGPGYGSRMNPEGTSYGSRTNPEGTSYGSRMSHEGMGHGSRTNQVEISYGYRASQNGPSNGSSRADYEDRRELNHESSLGRSYNGGQGVWNGAQGGSLSLTQPIRNDGTGPIPLTSSASKKRTAPPPSLEEDALLSVALLRFKGKLVLSMTREELKEHLQSLGLDITPTATTEELVDKLCNAVLALKQERSVLVSDLDGVKEPLVRMKTGLTEARYKRLKGLLENRVAVNNNGGEGESFMSAATAPGSVQRPKTSLDVVNTLIHSEARRHAAEKLFTSNYSMAQPSFRPPPTSSASSFGGTKRSSNGAAEEYLQANKRRKEDESFFRPFVSPSASYSSSPLGSCSENQNQNSFSGMPDPDEVAKRILSTLGKMATPMEHAATTRRTSLFPKSTTTPAHSSAAAQPAAPVSSSRKETKSKENVIVKTVSFGSSTNGSFESPAAGTTTTSLSFSAPSSAASEKVTPKFSFSPLPKASRRPNSGAVPTPSSQDLAKFDFETQIVAFATTMNVNQKADLWTCSSCHVENSSFNTACSNCGNQKKHVGRIANGGGVENSKKVESGVVVAWAPPATGLNPFAKFQLKKDEWKCPTCSAYNLQTSPTCKCCETPKPAGEEASLEASKSKQVTFASSTEPFSFLPDDSKVTAKPAEAVPIGEKSQQFNVPNIGVGAPFSFAGRGDGSGSIAKPVEPYAKSWVGGGAAAMESKSSAPASFTFSAPAGTVTSLFSPATTGSSTSAVTPFVFGAPPVAATPAAAVAPVSTVKFVAQSPAAAPLFAFGALAPPAAPAVPAAQATAAVPMFTFGAAPTTSQEAPQPFTFKSDTSLTPFAFGTTTSATTLEPAKTEVPKPFTSLSLFGGSGADPAAPASLFGGSAAVTSAHASLFSGAALAPAAPAPVSLFGGSAAAAPVPTSLFGGSSAAPAAPAFMFGGGANAPPSATARQEPTFSFGATSNSNAEPFVFGGSSTELKPFVFGGAAEPKKEVGSTNLFGNGGGGSSAVAPTSIFGGGASAAAPASMFGGVASAAAPTSMFGGGGGGASAAAPTLMFGGGGSGNANSNASLFGQQQPPALTTQSSFGAGAQAPNFGYPSTTPTPPPMFGGGGQSQPAGNMFGGAQPQLGGGMFGGAQPQPGGMFGAQQHQGGGSMFGGNAAQAPVFGGGNSNMFGGNPAQSQPQQFGGGGGGGNMFGGGPTPSPQFGYPASQQQPFGGSFNGGGDPGGGGFSLGEGTPSGSKTKKIAKRPMGRGR